MTARPARFHSAGSDERRGMSVAQVREVYLDVADAAAQLLAAPEVAARWEEPSALAEMSVRALAGHLAG